MPKSLKYNVLGDYLLPEYVYDEIVRTLSFLTKCENSDMNNISQARKNPAAENPHQEKNLPAENRQ